MTTLQTQWPYDEPLFGGIFSPQLEKAFLNGFEKSSEKVYNVESIYPYDLKIIRNKDKEVTKFILNFALSGFSKDEITVKVIDDDLKIEVEKQEEKCSDNIEFVHHGIAHRNMKVCFKIGSLVDKENISMKYEDGLLKIDIPVKPKETYEVKFN